MFDDLAVLEPEDLRDRQPEVFGLKLHVDMQHHKVAVGEGAFDVGTHPGELLLQVLKQRAKSCGTIPASRIVLDEARPEKARGLVDIQLVQGRIVERQHGLLVGLPDVVFEPRCRGVHEVGAEPGGGLGDHLLFSVFRD